MSQRQISPPPSDCLPSVDELKQRLHDQLDTIIAACSSDSAPASFLEFERTLWKSLRLLGCLLIQLFLLPATIDSTYRPGSRSAAIAWPTRRLSERSRPVAARSSMAGPS